MRVALELLASLALATVLLASPAYSQNNDLFVPEPKPEDVPVRPVKPPHDNNVPAKLDLTGRWTVVQDGDAVCNKGTIEFVSNSGGMMKFGKMSSSFDAVLKGKSLTITSDYNDIFGTPQHETWKGTVSADGDLVRGVIAGAWANGCTFTLTR